MPQVLTVSTIPGVAQFTSVGAALATATSGVGTEIHVDPAGDYTNHTVGIDKNNIAIIGTGGLANPCKFHMELRPYANLGMKNSLVAAFRSFPGADALGVSYSAYDVTIIKNLMRAAEAAGMTYLVLPDGAQMNYVSMYIAQNSLGQSLAMKGIITSKAGTHEIYCKGLWLDGARSTAGNSSAFDFVTVGVDVHECLMSNSQQGMHTTFQRDAQGREIGYVAVRDYGAWNNGKGDGYTHNIYLGNAARMIIKPLFGRNCRNGHDIKLNNGGGLAIIIGGDSRDVPAGTIVWGSETAAANTSDSAFDSTSGNYLLVNYVGVQNSKGNTAYFDNDRNAAKYNTFAMMGGYLENSAGSQALRLFEGTSIRVAPGGIPSPIFSYLDRATLVGNPSSDNARSIPNHVEAVGVQRFLASNEAAKISIDLAGMPEPIPANFRALITFFRSKADPVIVGAFDRFDMLMNEIEAYEGGVIIPPPPPPPPPTGEDPVEIARLTALLAAANQAIADAQAAATKASTDHAAAIAAANQAMNDAVALKTAEVDAANLRAKTAEDALANSGGAAVELAALRSTYATLTTGLAPGTGP